MGKTRLTNNHKNLVQGGRPKRHGSQTKGFPIRFENYGLEVALCFFPSLHSLKSLSSWL